MTASRQAPASHVEIQPWHGSRTLPVGPWRSGHEWMRWAACRAAGVDPDWFTVDEDAPGAAALIARAKRVCQGCPIRLWCHIHADETSEDGVYAGETHSQRVRRRRRPAGERVRPRLFTRRTNQARPVCPDGAQ